ncbi:MAG: hypothetical protein H8E40_13360 [Chloroflexi bacterium]|nr:hypothetical protein [Chloroflexota bacterium]
MKKTEAAELVDYMEKLWTRWNPTDEQRQIWVDVFLPHDGADHAKEALVIAYRESRYLSPRVGDYSVAMATLTGVTDQGVYGGANAHPPRSCPLFIIEQGAKGRPRFYTWGYRHGLPDNESAMLADARRMLSWTRRLYPKGEWIITDARQPSVGATDHEVNVCWRLRDKTPTDVEPATGDTTDDDNIPF